MIELIIDRLIKDDEIAEDVRAHRLLKYRPPALDRWSTGGMRDAFGSCSTLP